MNGSTITKGYRVKLRRELDGKRDSSSFGIVSWLELDIFVDDRPKSDRKLVSVVMMDYPGFSIHKMDRLSI